MRGLLEERQERERKDERVAGGRTGGEGKMRWLEER